MSSNKKTIFWKNFFEAIKVRPVKPQIMQLSQSYTFQNLPALNIFTEIFFKVWLLGNLLVFKLLELQRNFYTIFRAFFSLYQKVWTFKIKMKQKERTIKKRNSIWTSTMIFHALSLMLFNDDCFQNALTHKKDSSINSRTWRICSKVTDLFVYSSIVKIINKYKLYN